MKRNDLIGIFFLIGLVLIIYYPLFHAEYLYTDESGELWYGRKGMNFQTFIYQGRYLTYLLFSLLFSHVHTIHGLLLPRLFSLFGWMASIPIWYYIISRVVVENGLPKMLAFLSLVYLVCMPPFAISIGWASTMELFFACTSGLISGYILYAAIMRNDRRRATLVSASAIALLFGLISLFTYQNGFGCFFIPFLIPLLVAKKISRTTLSGICGAMFIYLIYFLLFRLTIGTTATVASSRSALLADPAGKLIYFLTRPMATAFHFTFLLRTRSTPGLIVYAILAMTWLIITLVRLRGTPLRQKFFYFAGLIIFFGLIYLPSLIVQENYASNRTLLPMDLAVFFLLAESLFAIIKKEGTRYALVEILAAFFLINAGYNFRKEFLDPLTAEYRAIKSFVTLHDDPAATTVFFVRPPENAFEKKYGIVASYDEFGVPSTAKTWTPDPMIRQLIFEKTGSMAQAEKLTVRTWPDDRPYDPSRDRFSKGVFVIDADSLLAVP